MRRNYLSKEIVKTSYLNKEGHIASALSILDVVYYLFENKISSNDKFILSKGHGCLALYACLMEKGYITRSDFYSFTQFDSKLGGHPSSSKLPTVCLSTGSLGHGPPVAAGLALAKKIKGETGFVYCLIGDGEANEGTIWETALLASTYNLNNLILIMDNNKSGERAIRIGSCREKFAAFGWEAHSIENGHSLPNINFIFNEIKYTKPCFIELNTIKGKGCVLMENNPEWHHKHPSNENELDKILTGIDEYEEKVLQLS